jgi:hypothetical protein
MHRVFRVVLVAMAALAVAGCGPSKPFDGPTVDAFKGRVVHNGQPVSFPAGDEVSLTLFHEKGQRFGIPLTADGSFTIGWMPIGKYSVMFNRGPKDSKGPPTKYNAPDGLTIEAGKTEYTIELGKGWKP